MNDLLLLKPEEIIESLILPENYFPNNAQYPLLIYKQAFKSPGNNPQTIQNHLKQNQWVNSWVDGIYKYHHYHSNTHETLVIMSGDCEVQVGGGKGAIYQVAKGDIIIFPAGVAHKNIKSSSDFKCIGAYPCDVEYDMRYGTAEEHPIVDINIKKVSLPQSDPIFSTNGFLFNFWK